MKTDVRDGWYQRLFAWLLAGSGERIDRRLGDYKRQLLGSLQGDVLEIGPGAGANLPYFNRGVRWIGMEPNIHTHAYLVREAARLGMQIDVRGGTAERLDIADASVDAVVCTLVLCSVEDQTQVLKEALRVLRPGGHFVFIEHVAALPGTWTRRLQNWVQPAWTCVGDGCRPNRETWRVIETAGFSQVELKHFNVDAPLIGPHIMGTAIK